jgi:hypothetical protein
MMIVVMLRLNILGAVKLSVDILSADIMFVFYAEYRMLSIVC